MAKPLYYPDWATQTVTLPGTGNTNKIQPKETIRNVGVDFGQIMTCEEMNWILNNIGLWVHYIVDEFFPTLPQTYLPLVGTKITMAGDATGNATWNGNKELTLSIQIVDNSHNHLSANITDASVPPTPNVIPLRDGAGSMYAGNNMFVRAIGGASAANFIMQNANGTQIGYIQSTVGGGGYTSLVRNNPSNGSTPAQVILYDAGYVAMTQPRSLSGQGGNGDDLVRLDYLNSRLTSLQNTLQGNINSVNSNLQSQITNNFNNLQGQINNVNSSLQGQINNLSNRVDNTLNSAVTGIRMANYGNTYGNLRDSSQTIMTGIFANNGYDNVTNHEHRKLQYLINGNWYNAPFV